MEQEQPFQGWSNLTWPSASGGTQAPRSGRTTRRERYVRISLPWLREAARSPGGATIRTALMLWFLRGVTRSATVRPSGKLLRQLGLERKACYRGLAALARRGLVRVHPRRGGYPDVEILDVPAE